MKNKYFFRFCLVCLCIGIMLFGVYALKSGTLTNTGTVGLKVHDCEIFMYGTIEGAVSDINNMDQSLTETFYFGNIDNQFKIIEETEITFADDLTNQDFTETYPAIYFNDAFNTTPKIIINLYFTNDSNYPVSVNIKNLTAGDNVELIETSNLKTIPAKQTRTMTIELSLLNSEEDITLEQNFLLEVEFLKRNFVSEGASQGLEYAEVLNNESAIEAYTVTGIGSCKDTNIVISSEYNGLPVIGIGANAFKNNEDIVKISLPNTMIEVDKTAFDGCVNLTFNQYDYAYYLGNDTNPYLVCIKPIISGGIFPCKINENCVAIAKNAFANNSSLQTIDFNQNLKYIGSKAFFNCKHLSSIELFNNLEFVAEDAFEGAYNITVAKLANPNLEVNFPRLSMIYVSQGEYNNFLNSEFWNKYEIIRNGTKLTFVLHDNTYNFGAGMTLAGWARSDYNTSDFYLNPNPEVTGESKGIAYIGLNGEACFQWINSLIKKDATYINIT